MCSMPKTSIAIQVSAAALEVEEVAGAVKRGDRFRIHYIAAPNHRECLLEGNAADPNHLVVIERARAGRQFTRKVEFDSLVAEARDRDDRSQVIPSRGRKAGLFAEFAPCTLKEILSRVAASRGNFREPRAYRMAVLS